MSDRKLLHMAHHAEREIRRSEGAEVSESSSDEEESSEDEEDEEEGANL